MADRVGVINKGELILVEEKNELMKKLGRKVLAPPARRPAQRGSRRTADWKLELERGRSIMLTYEFDAKADRTGSAVPARGDAGRGASPSRTSTPTNRAWRTSSSA